MAYLYGNENFDMERSSQAVRWGILGCGRIAGKFAEDLARVGDGRLLAVASRDRDRAAGFALRQGASVALDSYEALAAHPDVDAIYVATPHAMHHEHTLLCLDHGKPVLCEKAFAINAFAPILLARAVEEALGHGQPAWFASLSARVGSIGDNQLGGWYAYRAAKAAQNQLLRTLALEWRRRRPAVTVPLLHPGTTATALSEPFRSGVAP